MKKRIGKITLILLFGITLVAVYSLNSSNQNTSSENEVKSEKLKSSKVEIDEIKDTEEKEGYYLFFEEPVYTFKKSVKPKLKINSINIKEEDKVQVKLYKYKNLNEVEKYFKEARVEPEYMAFESKEYKPNMVNVEEVLSIEKNLEFDIKNEEEKTYLTLDDEIKEGHYFLEVSYKETTAYTTIQISDLVCYVIESNKKDLIWLNDAKTQEAVKKAKVVIDKQEVYTNEEGIAEFNFEKSLEDEKTYLVHIKANGHEDYILPLKKHKYHDLKYYGEESEKIEKNNINYWKYIYTDKQLYSLKDEIKIWGMLKSRKEEDLNDKVRIQLIKQKKEPGEKNKNDIIKKIKLSELGTYVTKIDTNNLNAGIYDLKLKIEEKEILNKTVYICDEQNLSLMEDQFVLIEEFESTYEDEKPLKVGESQKANLMPEEEFKKALYLTLNDGIFNYEIKDTPDYDLVMKEENKPNFFVKSIYFDGEKIKESEERKIDYDQSEKALNVEFKTNKEEYFKDEEVKIKIKVTDELGKPRQAELNINCIEADNSNKTINEEDILNCIYKENENLGINRSYISDISNENYKESTTYNIRKKEVDLNNQFKENLLFESFKTDENGELEISFKLETEVENLKISIRAISKDICAGDAYKYIRIFKR